MRKLFLFAAFATLISCGDGGNMEHDIAASDVPSAVTSAFAAKYPGATDVKWERETEDSKTIYESEFKIGDKKMEAFWDETGTFVSEEAD